MDQTQRDIGRIEGKVNSLESDLTEVKADVKAILAVINQTKGGWKIMMLVGGVTGAIGAFIVKILPFTGGLPK